MWVCFNDAFVSAVADPANPGMLKVRARKREHLEKLFPGKEVHESEFTDYRFRVFVSKKKFAKLVAKRAAKIDYDNFKDSVTDERLHDLYADFWRLHWQYQRIPDYPVSVRHASLPLEALAGSGGSSLARRATTVSKRRRRRWKSTKPSQKSWWRSRRKPYSRRHQQA